MVGQCIPGTFIEEQHFGVCAAPKGKFRLVTVDTVDGEFSPIGRGVFGKVPEQGELDKETGGLLTESQTYAKVYVCDDECRVVAEAGTF